MDEFLKAMIIEAGAMAKGYFDAGVSYTIKSNPGDFVTEADIAVSNFIIKKIHEAYPDHHIHSEEMKEDINPGAEYEWTIDPIDGTRNFATGVSIWCTMVAVLKNGVTILAAVYNPLSNELFFAEKGKGATLNGKPISVSSRSHLDFSTGSISRMWAGSTVYGMEIERFRHFYSRMVQESNVWIHQLGTMLACCMVARGGFDFFANNAGLDFDYLPGILICQEAGAVVTDSDGNPWKRGKQDVVIANPVLHKEVMKYFS